MPQTMRARRACLRAVAGLLIDYIRTAYRVPLMNAVIERFLGSVRRDCLDHVLILGERHLGRVLKEYVRYFNAERPHQGLQQRIPDPVEDPKGRTGAIYAMSVLGGLHHVYCRAA